MRMVATLALVVCAACGGEPTAVEAAVADSAFVTALRARLESATQAGEFSGAVLVVRDGHTLFEGAYGLADRERGVPNTPPTQFRVGSMNKMITAVAVLQLVQAGTLHLDAPLGTYLPDYPNAEVASKVTLHHLLTHTGGTGDIFGPAFNAHRSELRTTADYVELYGTRGLQFEHEVGVQQLWCCAVIERRHELLRPRRRARAGAGGNDSHRMGAGGLGADRAGGGLHAAAGARPGPTRRRCPIAARPPGAGTPPWGTWRASPPRFGSTDFWIRRTRRCSSTGRSLWGQGG